MESRCFLPSFRNAYFLLICFIIVISCFLLTSSHDNADSVVFNAGQHDDVVFSTAKLPKYLLYDVKSAEGFNLRRDVYIRVSNLVRELNTKEHWILVLPPWSNLYHWRSSMPQEKIKWSTFFDIPSLRRHIPVMEFEEYLTAIKTNDIDEIYLLQRYEEGWGEKWEERMEVRKCIEKVNFRKEKDGLWHSNFWGYGDDVTGKVFACLSVQSSATNMKNFLWERNVRSILFMKAEMLIHGSYSEWSQEFWTGRRSLRFSRALRDLGDDFRDKFLDSTDEKDITVLENDWTKMKNEEGVAKGGPYVAVHMRRGDFTYAHPKEIPSVKGAAEQVIAKTKELNLSKIFLATDAESHEIGEFRTAVEEAGLEFFMFKQANTLLKQYGDGGMAIIDQWICAHARYFMGTHLSTFSFRINEERSILGFAPETTFNRLCSDNTTAECEKPTHWPVKFK